VRWKGGGGKEGNEEQQLLLLLLQVLVFAINKITTIIISLIRWWLSMKEPRINVKGEIE
jgi:hypothetical protein